jgi:hypothetical protein
MRQKYKAINAFKEIIAVCKMQCLCNFIAGGTCSVIALKGLSE